MKNDNSPQAFVSVYCSLVNETATKKLEEVNAAILDAETLSEIRVNEYKEDRVKDFRKKIYDKETTT